MVKKRARAGKSEQPGMRLAVAWYTEAEWIKIKAAAADRHVFFDTYGEWRAMAEQKIVELRALGLEPIKTSVRAKGLLAWCMSEQVGNDGGARATYVRIRHLEKDRPGYRVC